MFNKSGGLFAGKCYKTLEISYIIHTYSVTMRRRCLSFLEAVFGNQFFILGHVQDNRLFQI